MVNNIKSNEINRYIYAKYNKIRVENVLVTPSTTINGGNMSYRKKI